MNNNLNLEDQVCISNLKEHKNKGNKVILFHYDCIVSRALLCSITVKNAFS